MKYLSFDIECCDGKHICEFGYVIVDEMFNVLERDCITINPKHKFILGPKGQKSNVQLAFSKDVYCNSPEFDFYYDRIKKILTTKDCQIVGFSLSNDVKFLNIACQEYKKELIRFSYYDFQKLYQGYTKSENPISVGGFVEELEITGVRLHKSDDDAWAVVRGLQIISEKEQLSFSKTLKMLQLRYNDFYVEKEKEYELSLVEKVKSGNKRAQEKYLTRFIDKLELSKEQKEDLFFGKSVCISSHFQQNRFYECLAIVDRLYSFGATYTGKASVCDIFIEYQDGPEEETRAKWVRQTIDTEGKIIQVLSLENVIKLLNLDEKDLKKFNM